MNTEGNPAGPNKPEAGAAPVPASGSVSVWFARDSHAILGTYAVCLFESEPVKRHDGFWQIQGSPGGGRWPVPNIFGLAPGEKCAMRLSPNH